MPAHLTAPQALLTKRGALDCGAAEGTLWTPWLGRCPAPRLARMLLAAGPRLVRLTGAPLVRRRPERQLPQLQRLLVLVSVPLWIPQMKRPRLRTRKVPHPWPEVTQWDQKPQQQHDAEPCPPCAVAAVAEAEAVAAAVAAASAVAGAFAAVGAIAAVLAAAAWAVDVAGQLWQVLQTRAQGMLRTWVAALWRALKPCWVASSLRCSAVPSCVQAPYLWPHLLVPSCLR